MFSAARAFNQDLSAWDVSAITDMAAMCVPSLFSSSTGSKARSHNTVHSSPGSTGPTPRPVLCFSRVFSYTSPVFYFCLVSFLTSRPCFIFLSCLYREQSELAEHCTFKPRINRASAQRSAPLQRSNSFGRATQPRPSQQSEAAAPSSSTRNASSARLSARYEILICIYIYIGLTRVCVYICVYICTCVYMCICIYACKYILI